MKTTDEVLAKVKELEKTDDIFGTKRNDLMSYLSFEQAKPYLKDGITVEEWSEVRDEIDRDTVIEDMLDYMEFAWDKANNCRGLSAGRSIDHYEMWLWLLEDGLSEKLKDIYQYYGKPCLRAICEKYNWDWIKWDDGEWRNDEGDSFVQPQATPEGII